MYGTKLIFQGLRLQMATAAIVENYAWTPS